MPRIRRFIRLIRNYGFRRLPSLVIFPLDIGPTDREVDRMRKIAGLVMLGLAWGMAFESCIFQTDPARPNSPPYIREFFPEELVLEIEAPVDSICFRFVAEDPDHDELRYRYALIGDNGEESILHNGNEFVFEPQFGGFYHLRVIASDYSDFVSRDWYVKAFEVTNEPPRITWFSPHRLDR
jgi:hypothetical protein